MKDIICIYLITSCVVNIISISETDPPEKISVMIIRIILGPVLMVLGIIRAVCVSIKK